MATAVLERSQAPTILVSLIVLVPTLLAVAGCVGTYKAVPIDVRGAVNLTPTVEDPDVGRVGMAPGFDLRRYAVLAVARFDVNKNEIKDDEDRKLAGAMPDYLQGEIVRRVRASGAFERVVNLSETDFAPGAQSVLRLEGTITRLAPGSRALRYFVGFGAGATKAQVETRFIDTQTGQSLLVTADRREAAFGLFGGDSEEHLQESFSDMARDLAKYLVRLRGQGAAPAVVAVPGTGATSLVAQPVPGAQSLVGTWHGSLRLPKISSDAATTLPVRLTIADGTGGLTWQLAAVDRGGMVVATGSAQVTPGDFRLSGVFSDPRVGGFIGALGVPTSRRVKVTYTGTPAGDSFEATGITDDQQVQSLSVRRIAR